MAWERMSEQLEKAKKLKKKKHKEKRLDDTILLTEDSQVKMKASRVDLNKNFRKTLEARGKGDRPQMQGIRTWSKLVEGQDHDSNFILNLLVNWSGLSYP